MEKNYAIGELLSGDEAISLTRILDATFHTDTGKNTKIRTSTTFQEILMLDDNAQNEILQNLANCIKNIEPGFGKHQETAPGNEQKERERIIQEALFNAKKSLFTVGKESFEVEWLAKEIAISEGRNSSRVDLVGWEKATESTVIAELKYKSNETPLKACLQALLYGHIITEGYQKKKGSYFECTSILRDKVKRPGDLFSKVKILFLADSSYLSQWEKGIKKQYLSNDNEKNKLNWKRFQSTFRGIVKNQFRMEDFLVFGIGDPRIKMAVAQPPSTNIGLWEAQEIE